MCCDQFYIFLYSILIQQKTANTTQVTSKNSSSTDELNNKITKQGEVVRNLKSTKASKDDIDNAVKILLALKADYKSATGKDWKPTVTADATGKPATAANSSVDDINTKINSQGDIVRNLKSSKAPKADIDSAVKVLLALKSDYKAATGQDWKPSAIGTSALVASAPTTPVICSGSEINDKISAQGELVRNLKTAKAPKADIDSAVKVLLTLKAEYKTVTGQDWKPAPATQSATAAPTISTTVSGTGSEINDKIVGQGDIVRNLKTSKAPRSDIDSAVKVLLALKADYKTATGQDWKPATATTAAPAHAHQKPSNTGEFDFSFLIVFNTRILNDIFVKILHNMS